MTTNADSGPGSLRDAMEKATASNADNVNIFCKIPCNGSQQPPTITLLSPLPTVVGAVVIAGSNDVGDSSPCSGPITIEGGLLPLGSHAFRFVQHTIGNGGNGGQFARIEHVKIQNVAGEGIINDTDSLMGDSLLEITNCTITHNQVGIFLNGVHGAVIGKVTPGPTTWYAPPRGLGKGGNVISGNRFAQIQIAGGGNNSVQGNFIGTNTAGTAADPLSNQGVYVTDSSNNAIGGLWTGQGNLIAGNNFSAASFGVFIQSSNGTSGGSNLVAGNAIGVDDNADGLPIVIPNNTGIAVLGSPNNRIQNNVISGNIGSGVVIQGPTATGNEVLGNHIGADATGLVKIGNGNLNVQLSAPGNTIGGITPGYGNVIVASKNGSAGLQINSDNATIQGNFIGTDPTGLVDLGNTGQGIQIFAASNLHIGGTAPGEGNLIGFNLKGGITLVDFGQPFPVKDAFSGNSIFSNSGFSGGIDLKGDGPTNNDTGDADDGPNHLQNHPIIGSGMTTNGITNIIGNLNSIAATTYSIEVFASVLSTAANREGQFFLGRTSVTTDGQGNAAFNFPASFPAPVPAGFFITATATDPLGNTSEFSPPVAVTGTAAAQDVLLSVTATTAPPVPGATHIHTFTLKNLSPTASGPLTFADALPLGLNFVSVTSNTGTTSHTGNVVNASISSLAGNASATITITTTIDKNAASGTYLINRATLSTNQPDPNPLNNATATATQVLPVPGQLANLSTRLPVQTGDNALIGGFIVTGTQPKKVIVLAIGPSLTSLGVPGALANPTLELYSGSTLLQSNDDWGNSPDKQAIIDTGVAPTNNLESAVIATLPANSSGYTAIVRGANNGTGIGVVQAYDLDRTVDSKLANISTRGLVQTGDNILIAGTIVVGQAAQRVIVRGIGPSLGIPGGLADPTLEVRNGNGGLLDSNDNWQDSPDKQAIIESTVPPTNLLESAIVLTLPANSAQYTAIVRGANNSTGIAVVEVYALN